jgi:hypothetical protein
MPRYRYTALWPEVFADLEIGPNARVIPSDGRALPSLGSTVILLPGDEIELTEAYDHEALAELIRPDAITLSTPGPRVGIPRTERKAR